MNPRRYLERVTCLTGLHHRGTVWYDTTSHAGFRWWHAERATTEDVYHYDGELRNAFRRLKAADIGAATKEKVWRFVDHLGQVRIAPDEKHDHEV